MEINVDIEVISKYIFKKLSEEEENAFEAFLDEHDDYAEITEGLMEYCMDYKIRTIEDFHAKLGEDVSGMPNIDILLQDKAKEQDVEAPKVVKLKPQRSRLWPYLAAAVVIGLVFIISFQNGLFSGNQRPESWATIDSFARNNESRLQNMGAGEDWIKHTRAGDHDLAFIAIKQLEDSISFKNQYTFQLFAGLDYLIIGNNPEKAIEWLQLAYDRSELEDILPMLITAYALNNQKEVAKQLLDDNSSIRIAVPDSILQKYLD